MPMYSFHCPRCGADFDRFLRPSEAARGAACPSCGEPAAESAPDRTEDRPPAPAVCGVPKGS